MMLRPATPLSVLLFVAFALLLLSVLSTPIIQAIPLSSHDGINYGVFGYCEDGGSCSGITIGYDVSGLHDGPNEFDLPEGARNTLSAILIVHPVAAFLTLVLLVMAVVAHLHSPSHSTRYLLIIFVFTFIDFLVCLLAFLIDVLVFVPHMAWGTYIVLAATILVGLSGIVCCAMRRTLISRKSRKKDIAAHAEMSGENYYNREAQIKAASATQVSTQPTMPVLSGGNGEGTATEFTSFDDKKRDDQVSDERVPLTSRSPTNRSLNTAGPETTAYAPPSSRAGSVPRPPRDQYGNPMNASPDVYGMRRAPSSETSRSHDRMNPRGRGGMPPGGYRGRGGPYQGRGGYGTPPPGSRGAYGPRGRGGYGPPPPNGRGAYGSRGRGGPGYAVAGAAAGAAAGAMMVNRPPPGYSNESGPYDRRDSPAGFYGAAATTPYDRRSSEGTQGYSTNYSNPSQPSFGQASGGYEAYNPQRASLPRAESPPPLPDDQMQGPVGQAVEMDATSGSPAHPPQGFGSFNAIRDSDADIAGMVGLQQGGSNSPGPRRQNTVMSDGSKYSTDDQYVPVRQAWGGTNSPQAPSPLNASRSPPVRDSPGQASPQPANSGYYEDIDPRFASNTPDENSPPLPPQADIPPSDSYEDVRSEQTARARSPGAESDRSNFTSISQRGVNPRWNPAPPIPDYGGQPMPRRPPPPQQQQQQHQRRQDMLLSNPDFELPGARVASPPRGRNGMIPGSAYPQGPM